MKQSIALLLISIFILSSCTINSHVMLKTPKGFVFDTPPEKPVDQYIISQNDLIQFKLFSNNGFQIVDIAASENGSNNVNYMQRTNFTYLVERDSASRLPIIGNVVLAGKTIQEAELYLQNVYSEYYVDPFIQVQVTNKRVVIFPGTGSDAQVIGLTNNNTTLLEALALAGGISNNGKARRIKIIRKLNDRQEIYLIDLSTIDGLKYGNMIVQGNDVIYVEPNANLAREALADITPIVSLISSTIFIWVTLRTVTK